MQYIFCSTNAVHKKTCPKCTFNSDPIWDQKWNYNDANKESVARQTTNKEQMKQLTTENSHV